MGPQATITNAIFNAFLKCKMKASLLLDGAEGVDTEIPRRQQGLTSAFEQSALQRLRSQASDDQVCEGMPPLHALQTNRYSLIINPVITVPGLRAEVQALTRMAVGRVETPYAFCPVRCLPNVCSNVSSSAGCAADPITATWRPFRRWRRRMPSARAVSARGSSVSARAWSTG